jgi:uncharacterized protein (DUF1778 family)
MRTRENDCTINIRVSKRDLALIDEAVQILGITRSDFIRRATESHARRIVSASEQPARPSDMET